MPDSSHPWTPLQLGVTFSVFFAVLLGIVVFARMHPAPVPRMFSQPKAYLVVGEHNQMLVEHAHRDFDRQRYAEAVALYRQAIAASPQTLGVQTDLALALWQQGDATGAETEVQKVLATDPDFAPALDLDGTILLRAKKDAAGAIAAWEHLLAANPGYAGRERVQMLLSNTKTAEKRSK